MNPETLQKRIFDWFERNYPDCGMWTDPGFHCYQDAPLELRVVIMTVRVEADISNGGLPQLLWNSFFHWRVILRDAALGYRMFGASAEEEAVAEFRRLFEQHEPACRRYIEECIRTQDFALFGQWCSSASSSLDSDRESLFYDDAHAKRLAWLKLHEKDLLARVRLDRGD